MISPITTHIAPEELSAASRLLYLYVIVTDSKESISVCDRILLGDNMPSFRYFLVLLSEYLKDNRKLEQSLFGPDYFSLVEIWSVRNSV